MRSSLTILGLLLCLLPTLASASALKGVRGTRRLQVESESPSPKEPKDPKEKKCKKYAEPKAGPKVAPETKATASDPMATDAEPKEAVAPKDPKDPKAAPESKATAGDPKDPKAKKADPKAAAQECLEWEESSDVVSDPSFGSTSTEFQSVNVDCEAIATDKGPTDTHSVSFMVNMDVLKDADTRLKSIYSAMEKELQSKIAPRIAGCSGSRMLAEESSKIVYVDFGEMDLDNKGKIGYNFRGQIVLYVSFANQALINYFCHFLVSRLRLFACQRSREPGWCLHFHGFSCRCVFCWRLSRQCDCKGRSRY